MYARVVESHSPCQPGQQEPAEENEGHAFPRMGGWVAGEEGTVKHAACGSQDRPCLQSRKRTHPDNRAALAAKTCCRPCLVVVISPVHNQFLRL